MMKKNLDVFEIIEKYDNISKFVIIKIEAQRRGVYYKDNALKLVNKKIHQTQQRSFSRESNSLIPVSFILRDGTTVITRNVDKIDKTNLPLEIDAIDGKIFLFDNGRRLEEIFYWEKPEFYNKYTTKGTPMWNIVSARPQRIDINPYQNCQLWSKFNLGCKFCEIFSTFNKTKKPEFVNIDEIIETVQEAIKESGRFTNIVLTGGAIIDGINMFDQEVNQYIKILQGIGTLFDSNKFPSQVIGMAYSKKQIEKLYYNTGIMSYTADIEVLDKDIFEWICPGKAQIIGYDEWKKRLFDAVEIFGKGNVGTGIVSGVELVQPNGFKSEEEAIISNLKEAEEFFKNGVNVVSCVWRIAPGSVFKNQKQASLEYYVKMAEGLDSLRKKYKINVDMDNYRKCGNHPDTDLARIW